MLRSPVICAPIALFVYNRSEHAMRTIAALQQNPEAASSSLTIFCDGPKSHGDENKTTQLRSFLRTVSGFARIELVEREHNLGLAKSIISGVSHILETSDRVIVLEDDIETSPYFLRFMNEALELYAQDPRVAAIHGYTPPMPRDPGENFFIRGADCWGWGTWKRAWDLFNPDGSVLLQQLQQRDLEREFDLDGAYPYTQMLKDQIAGKNNSWAIRWQASAFLSDGLCLYPRYSLVQNIGFDGSGEHCGTDDQYIVELARNPVPVPRLEPLEKPRHRRAFAEFYRDTFTRKVKRKLKRIFDRFT